MKLVKLGFKPFAVLLLMTVVAMVTTRDILYGADTETKKVSTAIMPEVVVSGKKDKKSYKPAAVSSAKYTEPLRDIPQTIAIVPQTIVTDQGAATLRDTFFVSVSAP